MSHFTRIKTRLVNKNYLLQALKDLGFQPLVGNLKIRGYKGRKVQVEVRIRTKNRGYDIGFKKSGKAYELVADWYGIKDIDADLLMSKVQQRYAYHAVLNRMSEQGFEIVEQQSGKDRTIRLTVRRTVV